MTHITQRALVCCLLILPSLVHPLPSVSSAQPTRLPLLSSPAAYGLQPYDDISKLVRMPKNHLGPPCPPSMALADCFRQKWRAQSNERYGLHCMHVDGARQPSLVSVNVNLWHWWRQRLASKWKHGMGAGVIVRGEWRKREEYVRNLTTLLTTLRAQLPYTGLWALHTSVLPVYKRTGPPSASGGSNSSGGSDGGGEAEAEGTGQRRRRASRVDIQHVALANAAIRSVAREQHLGLADWQSMLHLGWPREMVLADDLHPRRTSNTFIGNIYLHALAVL